MLFMRWSALDGAMTQMETVSGSWRTSGDAAGVTLDTNTKAGSTIVNLHLTGSGCQPILTSAMMSKVTKNPPAQYHWVVDIIITVQSLMSQTFAHCANQTTPCCRMVHANWTTVLLTRMLLNSVTLMMGYGGKDAHHGNQNNVKR